MVKNSIVSRQEILDAAALSFMKLGAEASSIDDIARSIGATKGRIYHHFRSKGMLHGEVVLRSADLVRDAVLPVLDMDLSPPERMERMAYEHIIELFRSLPYHKVVVQTYLGITAKFTSEHERALMEEISVRRNQYEDLFRATIAEGIEAGVFKAQDVSVAVQGVLLLINSPCFWYSEKPDQPEPQDSFARSVATQLSQMACASLT
jgi:AcrR family transcriptional regulator